MSKNPFKVDDRVYVYPDGWGLVGSLCGKENKIVGVERMVDGGLETQYANQSIVSFTEYDPINGGLSHERPYNQLSASEKKAIDRNTPKSTAGGGNYHSPWGNALMREAQKKTSFHPEKNSDFVKAMMNVPVAGSGRGRKAVNYIEGLLKEGYKVTDDWVGVEDLGDKIEVSLTFIKG